jgi:transposase
VCTRAGEAGEGGRRQESQTFATTTPGLLELRDWLIAEVVTCVAMESTSDYWRGAFYLLEDVVAEVMLVNPAHARNRWCSYACAHRTDRSAGHRSKA